MILKSHKQKKNHLKTKEKAFRREKVQRAIVESLYLSTMAINHHIHFATYSNGKKNVTQLIPLAVWKLVYIDYVVTYFDSPFTKDTLRDHFQDVLKELKTGNFNGERFDKAVFTIK